MLSGGLRPGARVRALHLRPVATRPSGVGRRAGEARIGVEAATRSQPDEDLARIPLQSSLDLDGIVAGVEDEQGSGPFRGRAAQRRFHLLGGHLVGVPRGADASHVHWGGPALAHEVELCDELVGPSGHDRPAGRVARRVVVEAALGATLRVASGPHARVHGVYGRFASGAKRMAGEQPPQSFGVDPPPVQRGVKAAPAATVRCLEAQVDGRRDGVRMEDGVGEFEESVAPAMEAFVERVAEAAESIGRFHDAPIMHSPTAFRTPYLPVELKRKLRGC